MTNTVFAGVEDFRDIEQFNAFREFTKERGVPEDVMMRWIAKEGRDNARTPMQWDDAHAAGFTDGEPWIKANPNYKHINALKQAGDPDSVFAAYQTMIRLRNELDVVTDGNFTLLDPDSDKNFSYIRETDAEKLLVICSFSGESITFAMPDDMIDSKILYCNYSPSSSAAKELFLRPWESVILYRKRD